MDQLTATEVVRVLYFFLPAYLANMAPVFARGHLEMLAVPLDGGRSWRGRRILGDHKTWRGIVVGVVAGAVVFAAQRRLYQAGLAHGLALFDYGGADPFMPGVLLGLGAGLGDALKSFLKRRIDVAPGASWLGFDQLDFMVGAYGLVSWVVVPPLVTTLAILPLIFAGGVVSSALGYLFGLKEAWI